MGKIMEAIFCVFYLVFTSIMGVRILRQAKRTSKSPLFGIMTLVLVGGDAFHLIPRIFAAINPDGDYSNSLGMGKLITSITMTIFYLILYFIFEKRHSLRSAALRISVIALAVVRIALCLSHRTTGPARLQ